MELRHLRCFVAVAEELRCGRAAVRLHMEQSPLSRAIKELEGRLGARLFDRDRRATHLTQAGEAFLLDVQRVFLTLEQAKSHARAVASGQHGLLNIALSDCTAQPGLSALRTLCERSSLRWILDCPKCLLPSKCEDYTMAYTTPGWFARSVDVTDDIEALPLWHEPILAAIPSRHPLLAHSAIPLSDLLRFPLIICHPEICEDYARQVDRLLHTVDIEPHIVERSATLETTLTLVAAGYGASLVTDKVLMCRHPDVVVYRMETCCDSRSE